MNNIADKIKNVLQSARNRRVLTIAVCAAAMLLMLIPDCASSHESEQEAPEGGMTQEQYAEYLESRLADMITQVDGAGQTRVMVTLKNGVEYVYANADKQSSDTSQSTGTGGQQSSDSRENSENSYIIIEDEDGEHALVRTELAPSVNGVVVACEGADDPEVRERIEKVVTTALNISSKRVYITLLSSREE